MNFPKIEFKIELLKRGIASAQIARHFGIDKSLLSHIYGNRIHSEYRDRLLRMLHDMQSGKFKRLEDY